VHVGGATAVSDRCAQRGLECAPERLGVVDRPAGRRHQIGLEKRSEIGLVRQERRV
jgi:hypothetical protein